MGAREHQAERDAAEEDEREPPVHQREQDDGPTGDQGGRPELDDDRGDQSSAGAVAGEPADRVAVGEGRPGAEREVAVGEFPAQPGGGGRGHPRGEDAADQADGDFGDTEGDQPGDLGQAGPSGHDRVDRGGERAGQEQPRRRPGERAEDQRDQAGAIEPGHRDQQPIGGTRHPTPHTVIPTR